MSGRSIGRCAAALVATVIAAFSGTTITTAPTVLAASSYTVGTTVARGYSGNNVGLNNYTVRNLGAYAATSPGGEALPVWCIQAHLGHSSAAGAYRVAPDNIVDSGALDYLLWRYGSFDLLDGRGEANDRAAAINGLTLFYGRSPRNGNSLLVWQNSLTGAAITPANSSGHRWNALPQFSLSFPVGMYDLGRSNHDRAEQLTDELFHEAERLAAPWMLAALTDDSVRLTSASGAPIAGHAVTLLDAAGTPIGTATTDAGGELTVTDPRVRSVRASSPGVHVELSAGAGAQRLVGGGAPAELAADVSVAWEPVVATQISTQSAMPFETITDSLHVAGVPDGQHIDVELELYVLDEDSTAAGPPLVTAVTPGLGNGWSHGHAPYEVLPEHQGAQLSYRERWSNPATGDHGPWSELGIVSETVTIGRFGLTSEVQTPDVAVGATVVDRVGYPAGLDADAGTWELRGVVALLDGSETAATATTTFIPDTDGGHVDVELPTGALHAGSYVVFQILLLDGRPVAQHADPAAESQWFRAVDPEPTRPSQPEPTRPPQPEPTEPEPTDEEPEPTQPEPATTVTSPPARGPGGGTLPNAGSSTTALLLTAALVVGTGATTWLLVQELRWLRRPSRR